MQAERARTALEAKLQRFRDLGPGRPPRGWLRAIRDSLGMTTTQYADRLGVSQPRVSALEKGEIEDTVTLATLRRAAEALDCTLVYAIVPNRPLEEMVSERAHSLAATQLDRVRHTMRLEGQLNAGLDRKTEEDRLARVYLEGDLRRLWDQHD